MISTQALNGDGGGDIYYEPLIGPHLTGWAAVVNWVIFSIVAIAVVYVVARNLWGARAHRRREENAVKKAADSERHTDEAGHRHEITTDKN